jgi:hypothetical protein
MNNRLISTVFAQQHDVYSDLSVVVCVVELDDDPELEAVGGGERTQRLQCDARQVELQGHTEQNKEGFMQGHPKKKKRVRVRGHAWQDLN